MLRLIASKDLREFLRDGRLPWAGGLIVLLLLTAAAVGWVQQTAVQAERVSGQALDYQAWVNQGSRHPHTAADQGMNVFKPEPPLAIFDTGVEPYVGSTIWLQSHSQGEVKFRPAQDATGLQRFGSLTPAWVLQVLVPLLVIILGFSAFASEREGGTLRQLLSIGVSRRRLLWGKALALGASVGLLLLPGAALVGGLALVTAPAGTAGDVAARLAGLALGYGLYLGAVIFLVLAVSAICRTSRVALFSLLAIWIVGVLIAPKAISDMAVALHPTPSRIDFAKAVRDEENATSRKVWLKNFGVETRWDPRVPLSKWGIALRVTDHNGYRVYDRQFGALWDTFERQQRLQEWAGLLAPVVAMRSLSMALSGTDFSQHRDFSEAAERQRRIIQEVVSEDLIKNADPLGDRHFSYRASPTLWAKVPEFHYPLPRIGFALSRHWPSLVVLAASFLLAMALALVAVSRRLRV
jgi:ABC-2 type transport system permease protein